MTILSNTSLQGVRDQVRTNALESFEFYANSVLSCGLLDTTCRLVMDVVEDRENYLFETRQPRTLCFALYCWLISKGVRVSCNASLPQHEVLHWLDLFEGEQSEECARLTLSRESVELVWL